MFLLFIDTLPRPLPLTRIAVPEYIAAFEKSYDNGGLIDLVTSPPFSLYYQTIHEKPLGNGYISRYPTSVYREYFDKIDAVNKQEYSRLLEEYDIRYLITYDKTPDEKNEVLEILYKNHGVVLYRITDLKQAYVN